MSSHKPNIQNLLFQLDCFLYGWHTIDEEQLWMRHNRRQADIIPKIFTEHIKPLIDISGDSGVTSHNWFLLCYITYILY